jgi:hypothetical protein
MTRSPRVQSGHDGTRSERSAWAAKRAISSLHCQIESCIVAMGPRYPPGSPRAPRDVGAALARRMRTAGSHAPPGCHVAPMSTRGLGQRQSPEWRPSRISWVARTTRSGANAMGRKADEAFLQLRVEAQHDRHFGYAGGWGFWRLTHATDDRSVRTRPRVTGSSSFQSPPPIEVARLAQNARGRPTSCRPPQKWGRQEQ